VEPSIACTISAVSGEGGLGLASLVGAMVTPGFTDAKFFTRLGAKWVGFVPVRFPRGMRFADLFHGHDERIPIDGLAWGTEVLAEVVTRTCG